MAKITKEDRLNYEILAQAWWAEVEREPHKWTDPAQLKFEIETLSRVLVEVYWYPSKSDDGRILRVLERVQSDFDELRIVCRQRILYASRHFKGENSVGEAAMWALPATAQALLAHIGFTREQWNLEDRNTVSMEELQESARMQEQAEKIDGTTIYEITKHRWKHGDAGNPTFEHDVKCLADAALNAMIPRGHPDITEACLSRVQGQHGEWVFAAVLFLDKAAEELSRHEVYRHRSWQALASTVYPLAQWLYKIQNDSAHKMAGHA